MGSNNTEQAAERVLPERNAAASHKEIIHQTLPVTKINQSIQQNQANGGKDDNNNICWSKKPEKRKSLEQTNQPQVKKPLVDNNLDLPNTHDGKVLKSMLGCMNFELIYLTKMTCFQIFFIHRHGHINHG